MSLGTDPLLHDEPPDYSWPEIVRIFWRSLMTYERKLLIWVAVAGFLAGAVLALVLAIMLRLAR